MFAGTKNGVYRSNDSGEHWVFLGLGSQEIASLVTDPQGTLLVASCDKGVFRYDSEARRWGSVLTDNNVLSFRTFSNPSHLFAVTPDRLHFSTNGGREWKPFELEKVSDIIRFDGTYFVATKEGLYRCDNPPSCSFLKNSPANTTHLFNLGQALMVHTGIFDEIFLLSQSDRTWRSVSQDRYWFPISNSRGELIAFGLGFRLSKKRLSESFVEGFFDEEGRLATKSPTAVLSGGALALHKSGSGTLWAANHQGIFREVPRVHLQMNVTGNGAVRVYNALDDSLLYIDSSTVLDQEFIYGDRITLRAVPGARQEFRGWAGDCNNPEAECQIRLNRPRMAVTAQFQEQTR